MRTRYSRSSRGGTEVRGIPRDSFGVMSAPPGERRVLRFLDLPLFGVVLCLCLAACKKPEEARPASPAANSIVVVKVSNEAILASTRSAEFRLTPSGALTARLAGANGATSLEEEPLDFSQIVSSAGSKHPGVNLDLAQAQVRAATGKLGTLGKRIEATGKIAGTDLMETLDLEIYDDFPNLALLSLSIRNRGQSDVPLDWVTLQRHQFAAAPGSNSPSHPLWTFQGASLKWGKDEIFPMPAKFSQENPFGAPVPTKDDLGYVGGGIPVVAFWSHEVGEAIGHVETLPLTLSIPVQTTATGQSLP